MDLTAYPQARRSAVRLLGGADPTVLSISSPSAWIRASRLAQSAVAASSEDDDDAKICRWLEAMARRWRWLLDSTLGF